MRVERAACSEKEQAGRESAKKGTGCAEKEMANEKEQPARRKSRPGIGPAVLPARAEPTNYRTEEQTNRVIELSKHRVYQIATLIQMHCGI